jgi:hypothetical protein
MAGFRSGWRVWLEDAEPRADEASPVFEHRILGNEHADGDGHEQLSLFEDAALAPIPAISRADSRTAGDSAS